MSNNTNLIERLFAVGAHFGFSKSRRHPSMAPYIFANKQGTDIFNLEKTSVLLEEAKAAIKEAGNKGKTVLFVGTKDEISKLVKSYAETAESPYVTNRWIGGMLTNFSEIKKRVARLKELQAEKDSGEMDRKYTKKERVLFGREVDKLSHNFTGISGLDRTPQLLVVVDPRHDVIAATEAKDMKIPVIGLMSSDTNLNCVDIPVVINDALTSSVDLVLSELVSSYLEGKKTFSPATDKRSSSRPR